MAKNESVFGQDWRDCLEEHYRDVMRRDDKLTKKTLDGVMHDVGYTDDDLRDFTIQATMRTEDVADGFVPDADLYADEAHDHDHPNEAQPEASGTLFAGVDVPPPAAEVSDQEALIDAEPDPTLPPIYNAEPVVEETPAEDEVDEPTEEAEPADDTPADELPPDGPSQLSMF